jgi:hypothetical protein
MQVKSETAVGQLRNVIWAIICCNGYNPCDRVFWGIAEGRPLSDEAWDFIQKDSPTVEVPDGLVDWALSQDLLKQAVKNAKTP